MILLYSGGESLVRGASGLAIRAGLTPLTIGLTVVAFGTSSPEFFVSASSAFQGNSDIALANIFGSNICNIGLILGCSALLTPLFVQNKLLRLDFPILLFITGIFTLFLFDKKLSFLESSFLTVGLLCYCGITFFLADSKAETASSKEPTLDDPLRVSLLLLFVGFAFLIFGANLFVDSAMSIAFMFGVSPNLIGLTVVAVGTSVPELVTSMVAAYRGQADLAVGNVIGSNIFNILGVAGISGLIAPLGASSMSVVDLASMVFFSILIVPLCRVGRSLSRLDGFFLLLLYGAYITYRFES